MYHILVIYGWLIIIMTNVTITLPAGQQDILDFCFCIINATLEQSFKHPCVVASNCSYFDKYIHVINIIIM